MKTGRNRQLSELVVSLETGAKLNETIGTVEELSTSHDERAIDGRRVEREKRRREARNVQRVTE